MRTTDGGATWNGIYSRKVNDAGWTTVGLDVTTTYGVHFDPFDSKRIFITYTDIGAFRSEDGGTSWTSATMGVPEEWTNTTYWMVFDPEGEGPSVECEQRHARSASPKDVAPHFRDGI